MGSNLFQGPTNVGAMLHQAELGQLIQSVGVSIAKAQFEMDSAGIQLLERLAESSISLSTGGSGGAAAQTRSLLSLGFTPTFYQISEVEMEAKVSISTTTSEEMSTRVSVTAGLQPPVPLPVLAAVTVDASYANKYSFSAEASSSVRARFVALPPPLELRQAIEQLKPATTPSGGATPSSPSPSPSPSHSSS